MDLTFDITEDELPIFLAETSEHLQTLDEGLVRLEREEQTAELLQALFRAAHTLKGSAGMIAHKRMVDLTHGMETALDGVRKGLVPVSSALIDTCLEAVDVLRLLTQEITQGKSNSVAIEPLVESFGALARGDSSPAAPATAPRTNGKKAEVVTSPTPGNGPGLGSGDWRILAQISPTSIASAARAFQIMMVLQDLGQIKQMEPDQATIETSAPVKEFKAEVISKKTAEEIRKAIQSISEVDQLVINDQVFNLAEKLAPTIQKPSSPLAATPSTKDEIPSVKAPPARVVETPGDERLKAQSATAEKTIRTSVGRLDTLMNLVGELITDRNRLYMIRTKMEARFRGDNQVDTLSETISHVGRITDQLQAEVMGIRMLPISNVFNKFPRLVRDLSRKANKQIDLVIRGEDTELDRSVIEEISDPLIHLLRNSVDHGIETPSERLAAGKPERGTIQLTARHEQGRIIITVEDDGRGLDLERVKAKAIEKGVISEKEASSLSHEEAIDLIFISGLSTARVISDVSGRGVGMDIVRNNIERLNGNIIVETWSGRGTQFQIVLPLTLAIVPTLLVRVGNGTYAIPLVTVTETLRVANKEIQTVNGRPVILLRDHVLPVTRLADVFDIRLENGRSRYKYVVVVRSGKAQMGLIVDTLVGEQEVVVKSLSTVVGEVTGISSAAILGDGQVALIVDVQGLFKLATRNFAKYVAEMDPQTGAEN